MSDLLSGVRVLECAVLFNGDTVGMMLGDLGADVIKIESPSGGDYLRDMLGQITPHHSPAHLQVNKHKRSVTIDLSSSDGLEVFWQLLGTADVFVDGFLAGTCDRLGVGYEEQRRAKPDIIYCHYSGFGATGPYAAIPTHGQMMNALAAAVPLATGSDGFVRERASTEPMGGTTLGGDGTAAGAAHATMRIAAALYRRATSGAGCHLDVAGSDAVVAQGWIGAVYGLNHERITDRRGLRRPGQTERTGAKYQYYETADARYVLFCCIEHRFWERFCRAVGRSDLVGGAGDAPVDFAHDDADLRRTLQAIIGERTQAEWLDLALAQRIPIGAAHQRVAALRDDPHVAARQIVVEGDHPLAGPFTYVGEPAIVDGQPASVPRPAPDLGEHTDEILEELGIPRARIDELRRAGVI